jgi:hypothetical protein
MGVTLDRHQSAADLALQAAAYKRRHPIRSRIRGLPKSLCQPPMADISRTLAKIESASRAVKDVLAPIFRGRALSSEDVEAINRVLALDALLQTARRFESGLSAPDSPPLAHPLYPLWAEALRAVDALPRSATDRAWFGSSAVLIASLFFFTLATVGVAVVTLHDLYYQLSLLVFGVSAIATLMAVVEHESPGRLADWPEHLFDLCIVFGAAPEAARMLTWHRAGTLSHSDVNALQTCLDIRAAMGAALYSIPDAHEDTENTIPPQVQKTVHLESKLTKQSASKIVQ